MKKIILYLLAINVFLCYTGIFNFCNSSYSQEGKSQNNCHSVSHFKNNSNDIKTQTAHNLESSEGLNSSCQYFLVSKSLDINPNINNYIYHSKINLSEYFYSKYIFEKYNLKIPEKEYLPGLFLNNSSFLL